MAIDRSTLVNLMPGTIFEGATRVDWWGGARWLGGCSVPQLGMGRPKTCCLALVRWQGGLRPQTPGVGLAALPRGIGGANLALFARLLRVMQMGLVGVPMVLGLVIVVLVSIMQCGAAGPGGSGKSGKP